LKSRIIALFLKKILDPKMAPSVGAQVTSAKNVQKLAVIMTSPTRNPKPKTKNIFSNLN